MRLDGMDSSSPEFVFLSLPSLQFAFVLVSSSPLIFFFFSNLWLLLTLHACRIRICSHSLKGPGIVSANKKCKSTGQMRIAGRRWNTQSLGLPREVSSRVVVNVVACRSKKFRGPTRKRERGVRKEPWLGTRLRLSGLPCSTCADGEGSPLAGEGGNKIHAPKGKRCTVSYREVFPWYWLRAKRATTCGS